MQSYILSYIPDANGIVEFTNDSLSFKGTMTVTPIDYDASDLLSQRHAFFYITIMYCDVYGTTHLAGSGCTGAYGVTFAIPIGTAGTVASQNNNGITIVGSQSGSNPGFGGGGGIGGGTSIPIFDDEENPFIKRDAVIEALDLIGLQKFWLRDIDNNAAVDAIYTFLAENQFSDESTDFAKEAVEALMEDGEVDWEEQIIKDESFKDTKADCVYEKFQERSSGFKDLLNEFRTGDPVSLDLKFVVESIPPGDYDSESNGTTSPPENGIITITINKDNLPIRTELGLARTLVHEVIHADIHRTFINIRNNGISYDNLTSTELNQLIADNNFPDLFEAIEKFGTRGYQHGYMAQKYIEVMAAALKAYDNGAHTDQFYEDFSWSGLQNTKAFRDKGWQETERLKSFWISYRNTGNKNCN